MKSIAMKFFAVLLAVLTLLASICGIAAMAVQYELSREGSSAEELWQTRLESAAYNVAYAQAAAYASQTYSNAPQEAIPFLQGNFVGDQFPYGVELGSYTVYLNGEVVSSGASDSVPEGSTLVRYDCADVIPTYVRVLPEGVQPPEGYLDREAFSYRGIQYYGYYFRDLSFRMEVVLYQTPGFTGLSLLRAAFATQTALPLIVAGCLLGFAVCMVYLCWAAGRKPKSDEIRPAAFNALPLDLYGMAVILLGSGGARLTLFLLDEMCQQGSLLLGCLAVLSAMAVCLLLVAYVFAVAAQVKGKNHFWWRRSAVGFVLIRLWHLVKKCGRGCRAVARLLPVIWQWALIAALMVVVPGFFLILSVCWYGTGRALALLMFLGALGLDAAMVAYGGWCFGTILKGARRMAQGDLQTKIDTKNLFGSFRDCAVQLNALSDAALIAAREQMKSERMKTELITNVSHDIKTPLTSIINYVDLLQKPHTEEEGQQYLEVLSRQSDRLKKLIEDLIEMSKASTGNVSTEITELDAAETVRQALGEFADKLAGKNITPVFCPPEEPVRMQADGRLCWRVMGNILSNAVKYAMPGTRLYVDVARSGDKVLISFKNISAQPLNISAEELMERFVRGDASRNTEGSGLGLNIAGSLMEVQQGCLRLLVDGDLFKVTLFFPCS